jgi:hypothetical protein
MEDINECFAVPISVEAFQEWQQISQCVLATPLTATIVDRRMFVWGEKYTASKFYRFLFAQLPKNVALNAIWKSKALPKLKVFCWLLMMDRLNTRDLMLRKHWQLDTGPGCVLCTNTDIETREHLFSDVPLQGNAGSSWIYIGTSPNLLPKILSRQDLCLLALVLWRCLRV